MSLLVTDCVECKAKESFQKLRPMRSTSLWLHDGPRTIENSGDSADPKKASKQASDVSRGVRSHAVHWGSGAAAARVREGRPEPTSW